MSARNSDVSIGLVGDLGDLEKKLASMPGLTKKAADKIVREWVAANKTLEKVNSAAAKSAERAWDKAAKSIEGAVADMVPGGRQVIGVVEQLKDVLGGASAKTKLLVGSLGALGVGVAAAAALSRVAAAAEETRASIIAANQVTGLLPETLAGIQVAGGDKLLERVASAGGEMQKKIAEANVGLGEARQAFVDLNVPLKDANGNLRSTNDIVGDYIKAVQGVASPTDRAAYYTQLFGGAGAELGAALGGTDLDEWVRIADRYGTQVGPDAERATVAWNVATQSFSDVMTRFVDDFTHSFAPGGSMSAALNSFTRSLIAVKTFTAGVFNNLDWKTVKADVQAAILDFDKLTYAREQASLADRSNAGGASPRTNPNTTATDTKAAAAAQAAAAKAMADQERAAAQAAADRAQRAREAAAVEARAIQERTAATDALVEITAKLNAETLTGADAVNARYDAQRDKILELTDKVVDLAAVRAALHANDLARMRELGEIEATQEAARQAARAKANAQAEQDHQAELDRIREAADARRSSQQSTAQATANFAGAMANLFGFIADEQIRAGRDASAAEKRRLRALFAAQKAAAIAQAAVNTALAVTAALDDLPFPGNIVAAAAVGVAGAVEIGVIAAQRPNIAHGGEYIRPTAPTGSDETTRILQTGEAVLNRRATSNLGGEQAVNALNAGRATGGGGPIYAPVFVGRRLVELGMADALEAPSPEVRAGIRRATGRVGHRGRRVA